VTTTYSQLVEDLSNHAGTDRQRAQRALGAVLGVLGERLDRGVARELAAAIPHEAGEHLLAGEPIGEFDVATFYERVSRRLQLDVGVGMELAQVVLREVASLVDDDVRRRVRDSLGPGFEERFVPPPRTAAPVLPERHGEFGSHNTLAEGRPGGRNPLSIGRPADAHTHSVARSSDPHGETTLSGGRPGLAPKDTLAEGRPGGRHPVSED